MRELTTCKIDLYFVAPLGTSNTNIQNQSGQENILVKAQRSGIENTMCA